MKEMNNPIVLERRDYLIKECTYLLNEIAKLSSGYSGLVPVEQLAPYLGDANVLSTAIERKIISSPGVINHKYKGDFITSPTKYGMVNLVDDYISKNIISEKERLYNLK